MAAGWAIPDEFELRERLDKEAHGVRSFSVAFRNEHRRFDQYTRNLAIGKTGYNNSKKDWTQITVISIGLALVNTVVGLIAAAGLLSGFGAVAVALGVSLFSIGVNIATTMRRNARSRQSYRESVKFIEDNHVSENIHFVQEKIMNRFSNYLNHCSVHEAREFARNTHEIIADAITEHKIKQISELTAPLFMTLYEKQIKQEKPSTTNHMLGFFAKLKMSIVKLWNKRKSQEQRANINSGFGMFDKRDKQGLANTISMTPSADARVSRPEL